MKKLFTLVSFFGFLAATAFASDDVWNYEITAKKLDNSRNNLSPATGGSSFSFNQKDIENLPQGQATQLNQVLLRAPSVVQGSQGQLFVRGDHSNVQYRINGVMLPDGVGGFGQSLDTHFADKIEFLTGAMPAQYGFRTAGVVDIKTKSGAFNKGARSEITMGGNDTLGLNQQVSGASGNLNYYLNASFLSSARGLENSTAAKKPNHNDTTQDKLFGYFSYLIDAGKRLNVIVSNSTNRFEIPNNPNQEAAFELNGFSNISSSNLNQKQIESNRFAIASLQGVSDMGVDYQISLFSRYGNLKYKPDFAGDLVFNGIASTLDRSSFANGVQGDFSYALNENNTLRSGFFASNDQVKSGTKNWLFALDENGEQDPSNTPFKIDESSTKNSQLFGGYLQNEFKGINKLTINYGARFDASRAFVNESQLSPRFGALYDLSKKTKIHAGFARYFTPPPVAAISATTRAKFNGTSNESESAKNDKVKAERTNYYDVGISHQVSPHLTLALDGYYKEIKNLLDEHQFGNSLIFTPFNFQRGKAYGVEFKADYKKENFDSYFNFAAQNAWGKNIVSGQYIHDSDELDYISKNKITLDHSQTYTISGGASYLFLKTKYSADAIYGSGLRTGDNNLNTMPAYLQVNGHISRDVNFGAAGKVNLRLSLVNIFDEVYQISNGSGIGIGASQYGPRRTVYLMAVKSF